MKPIKLMVRAFGPYAGEQVFDFAALEGRSFFLIHGPTGAGKTSILDAICFALYGQASGNRDARQMRSDHARPQTPTEVTFDFSIGPDQYRIKRQPEQERPKKKGTGTVLEKPSATLWKRLEPTNGDANADGTVLEEGWVKVNERVERLLGFKVDQFRQVVMLPQGMFQKLLMASSKECEEILEALFAVEAYGRIESALKDSAARMKRERETATLQHAETLRGAAAQNKDELVARQLESEGRRAAAILEADGLRGLKKSAADAVAAARQTAEKIAERDRAAQQSRSLEARREEFAIKQARHDQACKAATLAQFEEEVVRRKREADAAAVKLATTKSTAQTAETAHLQAAAALQAQTAQEPQREAARQHLSRLESLADKARELTEAAAAVTAAQAQLTTAQAARTEAEKSVTAAKTAIETAEKRRAELEAAYGQRELITARLNRTAIELNTRKALEIQRNLRSQVVARVDRLRQDVPKFDQTATWARQTLADLQSRWDRGQAALLARSLEADEPCPVCGSIHHPHPAHPAENLPSEGDLQTARQHVDHLAKQSANLTAELAKNEGELSGITSQIRQLEEALGLRIGVNPDALEAELKELETQRQSAEDAGLLLERAKRTLESGKAQELSATTRLAKSDAAWAGAQATLSAAQAILNERQASIPQELRAPGAVERERATAAERRKTLEDALTTSRKRAEESSNAMAKSRAELTGATDLAETTAARFEALRKEFGEKAKLAGFEDHAAFKAARLTDAQVTAINAEIRDYHVAMQAANERLERATAAAGNLAMPDLPALETADGAAQRALETKIDHVAQLGQQLAAGAAALARLVELEATLEELDERYKVIGAIADAANGHNDYNMTFQRYVLGVFLDEVLYAATQRLRTMSKGRFLLGRVTETASGNRSGGLDLQVHDTHTSSVRPVSTLSGGESFLASLSLALGLADVVQSYAGGIRLETIFVDEGFGTLDPESLDLAIRALIDLTKGGRLVGIISHVSELKERIDTRLEVVPGRAGSVARFVVG